MQCKGGKFECKAYEMVIQGGMESTDGSSFAHSKLSNVILYPFCTCTSEGKNCKRQMKPRIIKPSKRSLFSIIYANNVRSLGPNGPFQH